MKNTITISITKYYTFKSSAETMDVAFDEYLNTTPARLKYKDMIVEPVAFNEQPKHVKTAIKLINKQKPLKAKQGRKK